MKITYEYKAYPGCPRATEHSRFCAEYSSRFAPLIAVMTLCSVGALVYYTYDFWGKYYPVYFLVSLACTVGMVLLDFYLIIFVTSSNERDVMALILEERHPEYTEEQIRSYIDVVRKKDMQSDIQAFIKYLRVFLPSLIGGIAFVSAIKAVYMLCHRDGGLPILLCSIVVFVLSVVSVVIVFMPKQNYAMPKKVTAQAPNTPFIGNCSEEIKYCRKCGTVVYSDSIFCGKCGTKVR